DPDDETSLSSPYVFDVIEDGRGRIWAATQDGVNCLDARSGNFRRYRFTEGIDNPYYANSINFLLADSDVIWAGTAEGFFRLDPETGAHRRFQRESGNSANFFTAATPAAAG